jgi:hypothetical protein
VRKKEYMNESKSVMERKREREREITKELLQELWPG